MTCIAAMQLPALPLERFLKRYGNSRRRERLDPIYRSMLSEIRNLASPIIVHDEYQATELPEFSEWLRADTVSVVLAICTLGMDPELRAHELARQDLLSAVVLGEVALTAVTQVTRELHASIRSQLLEKELKAGPAYRPGVGRWPLDVQSTIFSRLPAQKIGVTLNSQLFMSPVNSTSLIIPVRRTGRTAGQDGLF
jgi:hypothetical protein